MCRANGFLPLQETLSHPLFMPLLEDPKMELKTFLLPLRLGLFTAFHQSAEVNIFTLRVFPPSVSSDLSFKKKKKKSLLKNCTNVNLTVLLSKLKKERKKTALEARSSLRVHFGRVWFLMASGQHKPSRAWSCLHSLQAGCNTRHRGVNRCCCERKVFKSH